MEILDGKSLSAKIKDEVKAGADSYKQTPILAVLTIGDDEASKVYVENKRKACEYCGMSMMHFDYADCVKESVVIKKIKELNKDKSVNGIILQLPIPKDLDYEVIRNRIDPIKDIDGVNDVNIVKLMHGDSTALVPCTALGIMKILDYYKIPLEGMDVTIIGRSIHIGKALYSLLLNRNCTVTICHSKTKDLKKHTKNADMVITSVGKADFITKDMVNKDVILIDVGFNFKDGHICGDVSSEVKKYKYLTPVPGGVGQMTVYSIYENLLNAVKMSKDAKKNK